MSYYDDTPGTYNTSETNAYENAREHGWNATTNYPEGTFERIAAEEGARAHDTAWLNNLNAITSYSFEPTSSSSSSSSYTTTSSTSETRNPEDKDPPGIGEIIGGVIRVIIAGIIIFWLIDVASTSHRQSSSTSTYPSSHSSTRNASTLSTASPSEKIRAWQQDWGSGIVGVVTTRPCLSLPIWQNNIDEEIAKTYEFEYYSMIPINRLKKPRNAWYTRNDGYAVTVIGCWSPTKHAIFFYRKSDLKKWTQNNFSVDNPNYPWKEIDLTSQATPQ